MTASISCSPSRSLRRQCGAAAARRRPLNASETILRNVRVLATDQRFDNQPTPDGKTTVSNFSLVTLESTPKMAEKIAVAQKLGSLSLSLRPLADTTQELESRSRPATSPVPAGTDPKAENEDAGRSGSRPQDTQTTFTTGGEVSRFAQQQPMRPGERLGTPSGGRQHPPSQIARRPYRPRQHRHRHARGG